MHSGIRAYDDEQYYDLSHSVWNLGPLSIESHGELPSLPADNRLNDLITMFKYIARQGLFLGKYNPHDDLPLITKAYDLGCEVNIHCDGKNGRMLTIQYDEIGCAHNIMLGTQDVRKEPNAVKTIADIYDKCQFVTKRIYQPDCG